MNFFSLLADGLWLCLEPMNLALILGGMMLGVVFGALPGISSSMGIVLMLPFTYYMGSIPSIAMLSALYAGSAYGGSITAILFNTPGTPEAVATTFDGYPMAQKGLAGKALGYAITASSFGGIFSAVVMLLLSPPLSLVALKIQSAEYFGMALLGMACISSLGSHSTVKSIISACFGILLAMIGLDPMAGVPRFTFDMVELLNGIEFIPVMIGAFALAEVLKQVCDSGSATFNVDKKVSLETVTLKEVFQYGRTFIKSSVIGTLIGILPGAGGSIAAIVCYGEAVRSSKTPGEFGKGMPEGVIAPESANNAAAGGAMIPTLVLGIPGSPTSAIILAALVMQGLQPGPRLMTEQPLLLYAVFFSMFIAAAVVQVCGRYAVKLFAAILRLPYSFLGPSIVLFSIVGSYALSNDPFGIWIMLVFGVIGFGMKLYHYSPAALILGMVLGRLMEENFRRQMLVSEDATSFFTRPISLVFLLLTAVTLFYPLIKAHLKRGAKAK